MERVDVVISLLRDDPATAWVADQVSETLALGVSRGADADLAGSVRYNTDGYTINKRDEAKRKGYETTQPYSDPEKLKLLLEALEILYVQLPLIRVEALMLLTELGAPSSRVKLSGPEEAGQPRRNYELELNSSVQESKMLREQLQNFIGLMTSDDANAD